MRARSILLALVLGAALAVPGGVAFAEVPHHSVILTGAQEAPGPGDANGRGAFTWSLDGTRLCYLLSARRIGTAAAAHIHRGRAGVAGPVRVELAAPNRTSAACTTIGSSLATSLREHPRRFYVNVHTANFPNGAIRAQLHF